MNAITKVAKNLGAVINKNSTHIMTALGCAGVLTTAIMAVKATPKAMKLLDEYRKETNREPSKLDTVKITWKCYIPTGIVGGIAIGCIIGSNTINTKRNAALAALYTLSETAFREYRSKVIETIGKNKELKIRDEIKDARIKQHIVEDKEVLFTGDGEVLCYDVLTGRYFKSDIETIRQSINELNRDLMSDMWISLNELYYKLGLPGTKLGDEMGFDIDKGLIEVDYSSHLDAKNRPCLAIDLKVYPRY